MTTLFNLFSPVFAFLSINSSVLMLFLLSLILIITLVTWINSDTLNSVSLLFSKSSGSFIMTMSFLVISLLNLLSLMVYNYPITTTLGFNLSMALCLWLSSVLLQLVKLMVASSLLPLNTPWYLIPFLSLVEFISIIVRPITLCFRLLANMSAGHILLTLICKMSLGLWVLATVFGVLELMVSVVQAFVFLMLVNVYLEEALTH